VTVSPAGRDAAGEVPPAPPALRGLPYGARACPAMVPEMLRTLAVQGERYKETTELALALAAGTTARSVPLIVA
jgi:hypothetical protein